MGQQMKNIFEEAEKIGGITARMRLSVMSKINSSNAESKPDTPEDIKILSDALAKIKNELNK